MTFIVGFCEIHGWNRSCNGTNIYKLFSFREVIILYSIFSQAKQTLKISVLKAMEDRKDILFGQFSPELTKKDKDKAWDEIFKTAKEILQLDEKKNTQYFRDVIWQNWRRLAVVKIKSLQLFNDDLGAATLI